MAERVFTTEFVDAAAAVADAWDDSAIARADIASEAFWLEVSFDSCAADSSLSCDWALAAEATGDGAAVLFALADD